MNNSPQYEIWGNYTDDSNYGTHDIFFEDCDTLENALVAVEEYRNGYRYAYIVDKETQELVRDY